MARGQVLDDAWDLVRYLEHPIERDPRLRLRADLPSTELARSGQDVQGGGNQDQRRNYKIHQPESTRHLKRYQCPKRVPSKHQRPASIGQVDGLRVLARDILNGGGGGRYAGTGLECED